MAWSDAARAAAAATRKRNAHGKAGTEKHYFHQSLYSGVKGNLAMKPVRSLAAKNLRAQRKLLRHLPVKERNSLAYKIANKATYDSKVAALKSSRATRSSKKSVKGTHRISKR